MAAGARPTRSTTVKAGRDIRGSVIVAGDRNRVAVQVRKVKRTSSRDVDILAELAALREALGSLPLEPKLATRVTNALQEASDEAESAEPDRQTVGEAVERALKTAKDTAEFAGVVEKLKPHIEATASWLGRNWHRLLGLVGLPS